MIGFGCAPILGAVSSSTARKALDVALDCGINHFDLARSYGYGEAEAFVGRFLRDKRSELVIATKFGIKANLKAKLFRPLKPLARFAVEQLRQKHAKNDHNVAKNKGAGLVDMFHNRISMNGDEMRKSCEESLRAMKTDYIDYFFLHEPVDSLKEIDDLTSMAEKLKKDGKIRAWGLAFMRSQYELHAGYLDRFDILQFDNSPGAPGYNVFAGSRGSEPNIIFSPLRNGDPDMSPADKLKRLSRDFPKSVILCSMFKESHIISNAEIFR